MSDSETQPTNHHLSSTLNVLDVPDVGEDVVLTQGHDDGLNSDDIVGPILSSKRSMPSSVSSAKGAQTFLVHHVPPSDVARSQSSMYVFEQQERKKAVF